jgi:proline dehydrogenase
MHHRDRAPGHRPDDPQRPRRPPASTPPQVEDTWLAIHLSHIGLDVSAETCRRHLATVLEALPAGRRIQVGAEDTGRTDPILQVVTALAAQGAPLMATVQANLRRSPQDVARLAEAGVPVRLCKGAYVEPAGLAYPWGEETDVAFIGPSPVEMLLGVRPQDARDLVGRGVEVRCYVPYGPDWFRYWMRRLAESQGTR